MKLKLEEWLPHTHVTRKRTKGVKLPVGTLPRQTLLNIIVSVSTLVRLGMEAQLLQYQRPARPKLMCLGEGKIENEPCPQVAEHCGVA